ncbi:MAG: CPBP family intramembrane metalloprotease [Deltaproteobacteria bacterium]|nr:CPBP family intramembrane metalloprotease [Deltaproteobacteria bacterium]
MSLTTVALVVPVALAVGLSVLAALSTKAVADQTSAAVLYAVELLVGAAVVFGFLRWMAALRGIDTPRFGPFAGLGWGALAGLLASAASGILYYLVNRPTIARPLVSALRPSQAISSIGPASVEEVAFRGGLVHIVDAAWGQWAALLAGSIPFGVLHLVGAIFGRPPSLAHVIGVSAGGWLLSLLYLRSGLQAAFACHWIWNSLAGNWVRAFQLPRETGEVSFEGAWTTDLVLVLLCLAIHRLTRATADPKEVADQPARI